MTLNGAISATARVPAPRSAGAEQNFAARSTEQGKRWFDPLVWLLPALIALTLGMYRLERPRLWMDEVATWSTVDRSAADLTRLLHHTDAVVAPYYLAMHIWTSLVGDSIVALRLPSVLAFAGAAAVTAMLGRHLFGDRAGLVAGTTLALVPSSTRYAQEARPYAIAVFFVVTATYLLLRALDRPSRRRWIAYSAVLCLAGLTHLICLTILIGHGAAVWMQRAPEERTAPPWRITDLRRWALATCVAIVPSLPLAVMGAAQIQQVGAIPPVGHRTLPDFPDAVFSSSIAWLVIGAALAVGLANRARPGAVAGLMACAVLPPVALFALSLAHPLFLPRYLLFTVPFWCILAAGALAAGRIRSAALIATCAAVTLPYHQWLHQPGSHGQIDMVKVAEVLSQQHRPGDAIVFRSGIRLREAFAYYVPVHSRPQDVLVARSGRDSGFFESTECPERARCLGTPSRVWVLIGAEAQQPVQDPLQAMDGPYEPMASVLSDQYVETGRWEPSRGMLALFTRRVE